MTAGKKMQLEILRIEKWVTENWVNVLTPSGVAKQAKKRTFDFGAPWIKITSKTQQAVRDVCRPFNLESMVKRKTRLRDIYICVIL